MLCDRFLPSENIEHVGIAFDVLGGIIHVLHANKVRGLFLPFICILCSICNTITQARKRFLDFAEWLTAWDRSSIYNLFPCPHVPLLKVHKGRHNDLLYYALIRYALAGAVLEQFSYKDAMQHRQNMEVLAVRAASAGLQPMAAVIYDERIRLFKLHK